MYSATGLGIRDCAGYLCESLVRPKV